jgi:rhombotail lipoprotein
VDLAVVDPNSRTLLLRAGGTDTRAHNTALVGSGTAARTLDAESLNAASAQLIDHFDTALTQLEADIKTGKSAVQVTHRAGYSGGGGSFSALGLSGLALAVLLGARRRYLCSG